MLNVNEYIDKIYENKEVLHTYKVNDTEGVKQWSRKFNLQMRKLVRDSEDKVNLEPDVANEWYYKDAWN